MKRVRAEDVHLHRRRAVEPEADDRAVAETVAVRRDRRQEPTVAGEGTRAVRDLQVVNRRRRQRQEDRERAHHPAGRIRTPRREATNGMLAPWTTTEKVTTTNTIS